MIAITLLLSHTPPWRWAPVYLGTTRAALGFSGRPTGSGGRQSRMVALASSTQGDVPKPAAGNRGGAGTLSAREDSCQAADQLCGAAPAPAGRAS